MPKWTQQNVLYYFHPFYNECRAYGRLKEVKKETLSVRCHGYLLLNSQQESQLQHFVGRPFNRPDGYKVVSIRTLVKDYIDSGTNFTPRMIPKMMRNIHAYHKSGISINDIKRNNYLDGILFDLSRAKTVPHPELTPAFIEQVSGMGLTSEVPASDYHEFDSMIDSWNKYHPNRFIWRRFLPSFDYVGKLRGFDPSNWEELDKRIMRRRAVIYYRPELYKWKGS